MEKQTKSVHLFNCDNTFNLDSVESLFTAMTRKLEFDFSIEQHYFKLPEMLKMSDSTVPGLKLDLAVFVVHAHESRLSINEDKAGIGYAKIYRALLEATGDNVIVVIGGDDNYKDEDEENKVVISRWARRKISSQFKEEYLDGRESFIFSWNKQHREIHEEALLYYFDPNKKGQKFEPKPKATSSMQSNVSDATGTPKMDKIEFVDEMKNDKQNPVAADVIGQEHPGEASGAEVSTTGSHLGYPDGSVLLETRLRYGKISYEANDVKKKEDGWQPPEEVKEHLEKQYSSTRDATVSMVVRENRIVQRVIITRWWQFWNYCTIL